TAPGDYSCAGAQTAPALPHIALLAREFGRRLASGSFSSPSPALPRQPSTYREYASRVSFGRRLASGPFSSPSQAFPRQAGRAPVKPFVNVTEVSIIAPPPMLPSAKAVQSGAGSA